MNDMVDRLMKEVDGILNEASWMGESTLNKAHEKLAVMGRKIGYPDVYFDNEYIEGRYKEVVMDEYQYYKNNDVFGTVATKEVLKRLGTPVDKRKWVFPTYSANAYHGFADNDVVFPAGLLQPPFFSDQFPHSINYAAIGSTIGHEITHGFDDKGSQRDKYGNVVNWWDPEDRKNFMNRSQCMVDQYSAFYVESVGMYLNGIITLGENIADNGGLKASYRAYKNFVSEKGPEPQLPGFDLTNEQLFFLGYTQTWCEKVTKESLATTVQISEHAPMNLRAIGSLQNFKEFSEAFGCPVGSPMNPEKKCKVW